MEMLHSAKTGYEGIMSAFMKVSSLNVEHLEKIAEKQLDTAQYYTDMSINQLKELQGIDSVEGFKKLSAGTMESGNQVAKKMLDDTKAMANLGSSYKDGLVDIVKSISAKETAEE